MRIRRTCTPYRELSICLVEGQKSTGSKDRSLLGIIKTLQVAVASLTSRLHQRPAISSLDGMLEIKRPRKLSGVVDKMVSSMEWLWRTPYNLCRLINKFPGDFGVSKGGIILFPDRG